jgi:predicted transporter
MAQQYLIAAVVGGLVLIFAGMYIRRYLKEKKK